MADYSSMYHKLFNEQTQAIKSLERVVENLKKAQQETEEMYMAASALNNRLIYSDKSGGKDAEPPD
jgi:hypothetical protein